MEDKDMRKSKLVHLNEVRRGGERERERERREIEGI